MARTPKTDKEDAGGGTSSASPLPWSTTQAQSNNESSLLFPSVSDPQLSYALPQWLVPERYKDKQSSQNTTQTRIFSVPLPEVPQKTRQAIRTYLVKHHQQKSGTKDSERKLKELKLEEKQAAAKAKAAKDKLAQALLARSEKLKEIRKTHEEETQKAMEELEKKMRDEHEKEDLRIEERIKEECKLEYEKKFEEEMIHKRKREQEEDEKEALEAETAAKKAKEEKEVAGGEAKSTSDADGVEGDNDTDSNSKISKVEALGKKQEDLQQKMEKLSEKKREFYWLLKQVIKQETLQKMKMKKAEAK